MNTTSPIIAAIIIDLFTGNSGVVAGGVDVVVAPPPHPPATTSKLAFSTNSPVG